MRSPHFLLLPVLSAFAMLPVPCVLAQEEPADLVKARAAYQREIEALTRPVNDRYLRALDQMKKVLGGKGDIHGALAVQKEIERVDPTTALKAFAGKWKFTFSNGDTAYYTIDPAGNVSRGPEESQRSQTKKSKITAVNGDFIIDWRADDRIERITGVPGGLQIDHFNRGSYPQGPVGLKANGVPVGSAK